MNTFVSLCRQNFICLSYYYNMLMNAVITKNYLDSARHLLSSSHLKTNNSQLQKYLFKERNKLPRITHKKDLFMQQLLSLQSLIDKNHTKSAQSLKNNKKQKLNNALSQASAFSSPKKGMIIFNIGQTRKIRRQYLVSYSQNQLSKKKTGKIQRNSIKKLKIVDRQQLTNRRQIEKNSSYQQEPNKYLSVLIASTKKKRKQQWSQSQLKIKQKNCKTEAIDIKNLLEKTPICKSENVSSRSNQPEHMKLKKLLHSCVVNQNFEKLNKYATQHVYGQTCAKQKWARTQNKLSSHKKDQLFKNEEQKQFEPWNNPQPNESYLFTHFES